MNFRNLSLFILLQILTFGVSSQERVKAEDDGVEELVDALAEDEDNEMEMGEIIEKLEYYREHPINLNAATYEQLLEFGYLSELQINALLDHRAQFGTLTTIYELQSVNHFDLKTITTILQFVAVSGKIYDEKISLQDIFKSGKSTLLLRGMQVIEKANGYKKTLVKDPYLGPPFYLYVRYQYQYTNKISFGVTAEKDKGEVFFNGTSKGFDLYSAHLLIRDLSFLKTIVIGDYIANFGQGLIMWSGFGLGKSTMVMNIKKQSRPFKKYSSSNENNFFRGIAISAKHHNWTLSTCYSSKRVDANMVSLEQGNEVLLGLSTLQGSGLHRSVKELEDKDAAKQTTYGGNLVYRIRNKHFGISFVHTRLNHPMIGSEKVYRKFSFMGDEETVLGLDYSYLFKNGHFFGELAYNINRGSAILNGVLISLMANIDLSILHRVYQKNYHSFYSNAFAERSDPINERGLFIGLEIQPLINWQLVTYFDLYSHPWLKYLVDAPSRGIEYLFQLTYKPSKILEIYARGRSETKSMNSFRSTSATNALQKMQKLSLRFHLSYKVMRSVTLKSRVSFSNYRTDQGNEGGTMVFYEIAYKALGSPISISARFAIFDIDSWNARIYTYERDVLYVYSVPAFQNSGSRFYLNGRYNLAKRVSMWIKISQTFQSNADGYSLSDPAATIDGPTKTTIKLMLRFKF